MNPSPCIVVHSLGHPRIGAHRELKKAVEAYWNGKSPLADLEAAGRALRADHWRVQKNAGLDLVPVGDFSFYDSMLELSCLVGNVPPRFAYSHRAGEPVGSDTFFLMARGSRGEKTEKSEGRETCGCGHDHGAPAATRHACEMTKWFDTNYHYIVPEFHSGTRFALSSEKLFNDFEEAKAQGIAGKPVLIGPVTYLALGKVQDAANPTFDRLSLLDGLVAVYEEVLARLAKLGATWIQIDEPITALDLSAAQKAALKGAHARLAKAAAAHGLKLLVASYFGPLRDNLADFLALPANAFHYDAVRGEEEIDAFLAAFKEQAKGKILSLGIVDGRNIWKNDFDASLAVLRKAWAAVGEGNLWLAPSCSLLHSPVTLRNETSPSLDPELKSWLAFAEEKLDELAALRSFLLGTGDPAALEANRAAQAARRASPRIHNAAVARRLAAVTPSDARRVSLFRERQKLQRAKLGLPAFPTTTIGSFPQTAEVRAARAQWKKGTLSESSYEAFLEKEIAACVAFQDEIGIDMPVHGEFERNDMVEYFGEQLEGFAFTANGWVQSYGSRCVKPPILFGDVSRPRPMTVRWSAYAQTLTRRPMKGMLTGPVTILQWSFVRNDQPRSATARQIALAIRDEVVDLERVGLAAIQIDEPAIREGLPLRRADWAAYLAWAVEAFRLSASGVRDETQIHTHMCYAEFNDIIQAVADLDADVITIETSRSNMELLGAFANFNYPNEIGPGVYDIHSPRIPETGEMERLMEKAKAVLPPRNLWVNPDCGLKTRAWAEVKPALKNLVETAKRLRAGV
ncbi:methionine synthase (B12-independent) [Verrucomicrobium sp. GAS474]|uniref:5-methyltetrahydropteroyltriglutamate-- homocysteine S-methyltransferase n=1 Tax=Verrucomicrobium sp. GAS474 TaxID=1882831 RepID=UPI00087C45D6|nr:5-methyltetrahydropteroyltriglutamate--homocysteine S-methyltransferase [Verrucomicrobium sp. GAS474]SDT91999.1 methionine synthase (B12-independent) [Verrucomicrobium sp. GAS474]